MATSESDSPAEPEILDAEIVGESAGDAPKVVSDKPKKTYAGWWLSLSLALFIAGLFTAPYARSALERAGLLSAVEVQPSGSSDASDAALLGRLNRLESGLTSVEDSLAAQRRAVADMAARIDGLDAAPSVQGVETAALNSQQSTARVDALAEDVAALRRSLANLSSAGRTDAAQGNSLAQLEGALAAARVEIDSLTARLETYERVASDLAAGALTASPRGRLLVTLSAVREALDTGGAFSTDLAVIRQEISALDPAAQADLIGPAQRLAAAADGVPSYEALVGDFQDVAAALKQTAEKAEGRFLASLFTVRRTDASANGVDAVLNAAERSLAARDLKAAADQLSTLAGAGDAPAQAWIAGAYGRAAALSALEDLRSGLLARGEVQR